MLKDVALKNISTAMELGVDPTKLIVKDAMVACYGLKMDRTLQTFANNAGKDVEIPRAIVALGQLVDQIKITGCSVFTTPMILP